jgi:peptidoglycan/LPS O-acetylase OafA/YrhL
MNNNINFYNGVNNLRGISALWVMLGHYYFFIYLDKTIIGYLKFFDPVGMFFLISGFLIPYSLEKYGTIIFLKKRFFRIFPIVIFFTIVHLIFINHSITTLFVTMTLSFDVLQRAPQISVYWSLAIEVFFYIILAVFYSIFNKNIFKGIIYSLVFILSMCYFLKINEQYYYVSVLSRYISILTFIYIGTSFYKLITIKQIKWLLLMLMLFIFLYFTIFILHLDATNNLFDKEFVLEYPNGVFIINEILKNRIDINDYFISKITSFLIFIVFFYFLSQRNIFLDFLAKISYSLYISHLTVYYFLIKFGYENTSLKLGLISTFITIAISYVTYIYIEKPFINFSKKR